MTDDRRPHELESDDPGAFIGHEPERSTETIPGGVGPKDERVSATQSRVSGGEHRENGDWPEGHREGGNASDDAVREAGEDH
ncbi:MAG TPA: hypothetical protein VH723_03840 [Candidatus Limnocylindrales bacterium]|jgi:hypothetical protein